MRGNGKDSRNRRGRHVLRPVGQEGVGGIEEGG